MTLSFVPPISERSKKLCDESVVLRSAARIAVMEAREALDRSREIVAWIKERQKTRLLKRLLKLAIVPD